MRMKQQYDFRVPPKPVSSEDIARHKDFEALLQAYHAGARRKGIVQMRYLMYAGIGLVAAAMALLLIVRAPQDAMPQSSKVIATWEKQARLPAPLPALQPEFWEERVDAAQPAAMPGNPRIQIPAQAFVDEQGNPVAGEVQLRVRKLDDYVDFFLAGVKLGWNTPNGRRQLESAGMVEVYAEQNGRRVFLAPGKTLSIEMESVVWLPLNRRLPALAEFYLDTEAATWVEKGRSKTEMLGQAEPDPQDPGFAEKFALYQQLQDLDQALAQERSRWEAANPAPTPPAKPQRSDPNQPTLELDFLEGAVPQTASGEEADLYKGVIWQIAPHSPAYDQRAFSVTWQSARIKQIQGDDYELILMHGATSLRLIVNPVLAGSAYEQAMNAWRAAYAEYEAALRRWEAQRDQNLAAVQQRVDKEKTQLLQAWEKQHAGAAPLAVRLRHRLDIDQLGLWTIAHPVPAPATVAAGKITDQYDNAYHEQVAYVVSPGQNTLHQVMIAGNSRLPLEPGSVLWSVTPEGKVAVLRPQALQKALSSVNSPDLVLELQEEAPASKADLRRMLRL